MKLRKNSDYGRKRAAALLVTPGVIVATSVGIAGPAEALGLTMKKCGSNTSVVGNSTSVKAQTLQNYANACGRVKVGIGYYGPGGTSKFSSWKYGSKEVTMFGTSYGTIFQGRHGVTHPGSFYAGAEFFTT